MLWNCVKFSLLWVIDLEHNARVFKNKFENIKSIGDRVCLLLTSGGQSMTFVAFQGISFSPFYRNSIIVDIWRLGCCLICREYFGGFVQTLENRFASFTSFTVINLFGLAVKKKERNFCRHCCILFLFLQLFLFFCKQETLAKYFNNEQLHTFGKFQLFSPFLILLLYSLSLSSCVCLPHKHEDFDFLLLENEFPFGRGFSNLFKQRNERLSSSFPQVCK